MSPSGQVARVKCRALVDRAARGRGGPGFSVRRWAPARGRADPACRA